MRLEGFPKDFPSNQICRSEGKFFKSEVAASLEQDEGVGAPNSKKIKIDTGFRWQRTIFHESVEDNIPTQDVNVSPGGKHVKFSHNPPEEFVTFSNREYDRKSPSYSPKECRRKNYYRLWQAGQGVNCLEL